MKLKEIKEKILEKDKQIEDDLKNFYDETLGKYVRNVEIADKKYTLRISRNRTGELVFFVVDDKNPQMPVNIGFDVGCLFAKVADWIKELGVEEYLNEEIKGDKND